VRRERDIIQARERVIALERLGVNHVKAGVTNPAALIRASISAASSTSAPRAVLPRIAPGLKRLSLAGRGG
jgi:hypothetical protein